MQILDGFPTSFLALPFMSPSIPKYLVTLHSCMPLTCLSHKPSPEYTVPPPTTWNICLLCSVPVRLIFPGPSQCSLLSKSLLWCPWATPVNPLSGGSSSQGCSLWRWAYAWLMALGIEEGTSLLWLWWKLFLLLLRTSYLHGYAGLWHLTSGTSSMFSSYNLNNPGAESGGSSETLSQTIGDSSSKFRFSASNTVGGEGTEEFI